MAMFALLRPVESSVRRLIAIAARGLILAPVEKRAAPCAPIPKGSGAGGRIPCFALFDPRRRIGTARHGASGANANVWFLDGLDVRQARPAPPSPDDMLSTARLRRRLAAVLHALETIPKQARRLARAYLKQERPIRPMRPGRPPGFRAKGQREIDDILADCHELALIALAETDGGDR